VPEEETTDERGSTTAQESAAASDNGVAPEAPPEPELTLEALQEQLAAQSRKAEEYFDQLQRLQADFQNYRRRMTQERLEAASRGKEDVLRGLIPVLNNFHLALQHADQDASAVRQGVQMIWQQFEGFLRDQKVEPIPTIGQVFDPAYHEVLSPVPATAETPANTIVTEVRRDTVSTVAYSRQPRSSWHALRRRGQRYRKHRARLRLQAWHSLGARRGALPER